MKKVNSKITSKTALVGGIVFLMAGILSCSSTPEQVGNEARGEPKSTTVASIEAKQVAAEQQAPFVVEVEFNKRSNALGPSARARVHALLKSMPAPERLKSVKIVAWGDEEYPSASKRKLSQEQTDLAKRRGESIENFLKEKNTELKVQHYNMAKRPGKISDFFGTDDARIKESLERAGVSTTDGNTVNSSTSRPAGKPNSKARKAILMLVLEEGNS